MQHTGDVVELEGAHERELAQLEGGSRDPEQHLLALEEEQVPHPQGGRKG